jgi:hypothetical protein
VWVWFVVLQSTGLTFLCCFSITHKRLVVALDLLVTFFLLSWALFSLWHSWQYTDVAWHWVQITMVCEKPCNIYNRGKMQQMSPINFEQFSILNSLDAFATHITHMLSSVHTLQDWGMSTNVSLNIIFIIFSGTCGFKFIYTLWSIILCENCSSMVSRQVQPSHSPLHATRKYHVIVESLPWNPRWLHYHMAFTWQRWVSANITCPPVLFFCKSCLVLSPGQNIIWLPINSMWSKSI